VRIFGLILSNGLDRGSGAFGSFAVVAVVGGAFFAVRFDVVAAAKIVTRLAFGKATVFFCRMPIKVRERLDYLTFDAGFHG
jgi:hypothetical protein